MRGMRCSFDDGVYSQGREQRFNTSLLQEVFFILMALQFERLLVFSASFDLANFAPW
jgi:hypothetical protein